VKALACAGTVAAFTAWALLIFCLAALAVGLTFDALTGGLR
jgi:hypothetical protein